MATNLYVGGLPYSTTDEAVRELFAQIGEVRSVRVMIDRETQQRMTKAMRQISHVLIELFGDVHLVPLKGKMVILCLIFMTQ